MLSFGGFHGNRRRLNTVRWKVQFATTRYILSVRESTFSKFREFIDRFLGIHPKRFALAKICFWRHKTLYTHSIVTGRHKISIPPPTTWRHLWTALRSASRCHGWHWGKPGFSRARRTHDQQSPESQQQPPFPKSGSTFLQRFTTTRTFQSHSEHSQGVCTRNMPNKLTRVGVSERSSWEVFRGFADSSVGKKRLVVW